MKKVCYVMFSLFLFIIFSSTAFGAGKSGTTLSASLTADGSWVKKSTYDWTITKSSNVLRPVIHPGQSLSLIYTLQTTRKLVSESELTGVRGEITVTNGGNQTTEGLQIVPQVQYKNGSGPFSDLPGAAVTIVPTDPLQPGQTKSYAYEIFFKPVSGAQYKIAAKATITNHSGHLNIPFGPEPKQDYSLPLAPQPVFEDATAAISDTAQCPAGFTCTSSHPAAWNVTDSATITYTLTATNHSASIPQILPLKNMATLTESTTKQVRSAENTVLIFTGCSCTKP